MSKTIVVNYKIDEYDILISRPSKWGNPFSHRKFGTQAQFIVESREAAIEAYRNYIINGEGKWLLKHLYELKGKRIACCCSPFLACHGDVLAELANALPEPKYKAEDFMK